VSTIRSRPEARCRALEFLFGLSFTDYAWEDEIEDFWALYPAKAGVRQYAERLIRGVSKYRETLDAHIESVLQGWRPGRIGHIERTVLRIALFEMLYREDVPDRVVINEAIELTRDYGTEEAPRFVNGVLDRLRKKLREAEETD
jgi:transcription antitermination protein NusB